MPVQATFGGLSVKQGFGNQVLYEDGIYRYRYTVGYFADDFEWFDTRTPATTVIDTSPLDHGGNVTGFSVLWSGYFLADRTETFTFYTNSDDSSVVWIGNNARLPRNQLTTANATVNNSGAHVPRERSGTFAMTDGVFYPILIMYGNNTGPATFEFSIESNTITKTTNVTGYLFHNINTLGI